MSGILNPIKYEYADKLTKIESFIKNSKALKIEILEHFMILIFLNISVNKKF
jgi:hypothetical protein